MHSGPIHFSPDSLTSLAATIFERAGLAPDAARIEADNLVYADLRGHSAHGVTRIPIYTERLLCGVVNKSPAIRTEQRSESAAVVFGDNGPGAVVSDAAMKTAINLARTTGIGMVVARESNHNGPCAFYATQASDLSLIGVSATNAPVSMAVWGGRGRALGTNPFSFAVPAKKYPAIVVDMASSMVARGKIVEAAKRGENIPVGLALSPEGAPTTDAREAEAGVVLPFAGPKGSGIAILVDLFCGVLSGASFGSLVNNLYNEFEKPQDNGHFFLAVDPRLFLPREEFLARVDQFIALMKGTSLAQGCDEILMPGEPELRKAAALKHSGIPLPLNVVADLQAICDRLGVTMPGELPASHS